jgi:GNAT superfamily N-acetyltransferase
MSMRVHPAQPGDERAIYDMVLYARRRVLLVEWSELRAMLLETAHPTRREAVSHVTNEVDLLCGEAKSRLGAFWASTTGAGQIAHLNALVLHNKWPGREIAAEFLSGVKQRLRESGLAQIAYVGAELWLTRLLAESEFTLSGNVITLQKAEDAVPDRGNQCVDIRPAQASHLAEILALDERAFVPLWRTDARTLAHQLTVSPFFVIAELKQRTVGYAYVSLTGRHGHLTRLVIDPDLQGKRIGVRLLAECVDYFFRQGVYGITLNTQEDNVQALRLYRWFGFALVGHEAGVWLCSLA